MTVERTIHGGWRISTITDGYRVSQLYLGYTKREAIRAFRQYLRTKCDGYDRTEAEA